MANIRKTFNFRNGVQVDEDNLVVNSLGLVGIGTSVPTEALDVRGTAKVVGLVTASQIFTNSLTVGFTTDGNLGVATVAGTLNVGIITVGNLSIKSGVITSTSGIVTYYGDGRFLQGLPTSQWVDIDVGLGYTSIYVAGNVGVATVDPRFTFQVGGNNNVGNFQSGVGINSTGDILATGIISATTLRGDGSLITGINASNISSGTLNNSRLPTNLNISGVSTFLQSLYINQNLNVPIIDGPVTVSGSSTITGSLTVGGATTITGSLTVGGLSAITGSLSVGILTATSSYLGISTATNLQSNNIRLGVSGNSEIDTTSGNLTLDSTNGTTIIDDNLSVSGISTFTGEVRIDTGIIPDTSKGSYIGTSGRPFAEAYINDIEIGNVLSSRIRSLGGTLLLDSTNNQVDVNTNFYITGITTLNNILNVTNSILPVSDLSVTLGSNTKRFNQAYISAIQVGAALSNKINTVNAVDLILDSATGTTFVDDNLKVSGLGTFSGLVISNQGFVPATNSVVPLGTPSLRFSEAYIDNIRIGVAQTNVIDTVNSNLILDSSTGITEITDNLYVTGIGSFTGAVTSKTAFIPDDNLGADLGTTTLFFSNAYVNTVNSTSLNASSVIVGVDTGKISTDLGENLTLDSNSGIINVESNLRMNSGARVTGVITATKFIGDGSGLTGIVGSGSGVIVRDDGSLVGTAGTIDFGTGLSVSPISSGIVTVTTTGNTVNTYWAQGVSVGVGIHTLSTVAIGTNTVDGNSNLYVKGDVKVEGSVGIDTNLQVFGNTSVTGITTSQGGFTSGIGVTNPVKITVSGNILTFNVVGVGSTSLILY